MEQAGGDALEVETLQNLAELQRRLAPVVARERLRGALERLDERVGDDQSARLDGDLKAVADAQVVAPNEPL